MQVVKTSHEFKALRKNICKEKKVGYVATMGNLHIGHSSLITQSIADNDLTVVSIFVNPTQFNQTKDFNNYPRTLDADLELLKSLNVDYCFLPSGADMYTRALEFFIDELKSSQIMEGKYRPGHFRGMLTVVMKLLNIIRPHRAYFGEKDYQQLLLIKSMAQDLFLDVTIISCPTIRSKQGLAHSSRNNCLTTHQTKLAEQFANILISSQSCAQARHALEQLNIKVDYLEEHWQRRFAAVWIDEVRLIDNILLC